MSYLDLPRLAFLGKFSADVPTQNNLPPYYNPKYPGAGERGTDWNDKGDCVFNYKDCQVQSFTGKDATLYSADGRLNSTKSGDPILNATVTTDPRQVQGDGTTAQLLGNGKIVDLDVDQRRVTELYGITICIVLSDDTWISGELSPCHIRNFWTKNARTGIDAEGLGRVPQSAVWQSVLKNIQWQGDIESSMFLSQLKEISDENGNQVSIRMIVDGFLINAESTEHLSGRMAGVIGPYFEGEPTRFVAERRVIQHFLPTAFDGDDPSQITRYGSDLFWPAPCKIDTERKKLIFDLGNAVQLKQTLGESVIPEVYAAIMPSEAEYQIGDPEGYDKSGELNLPPKVIEPALDCSKAQFELTGRIVDTDVTDDDIQELEDHRICVVASKNAPWPVLSEYRDGRFADLDSWVVRLNPGESSEPIELYARKFGKPLVGETFDFNLIDHPSPYITLNEPRDLLSKDPSIVTTNSEGRATITFTAKKGAIIGLPPGRAYVGSQLYLLGDITGWQSWGQVGPPVSPYLLSDENYPISAKGPILNIVVYDEGDPIDNPEWKDVVDVLSEYARLYPGMTEKVDLSKEEIVRANTPAIYDAMKLPITSPFHMPVTRDLSAYHRKLILDFLEPIVQEIRSGTST